MEIINSREIVRDGITYEVTITPDDEATFDPEERVDDAMRDAYDKGAWRFVGVIVNVDGGPRDMEAALWCVGYGGYRDDNAPNGITFVGIQNYIDDPWMECDGVAETLVDCLIAEVKVNARGSYANLRRFLEQNT
jgi:hypothetical protein